MTYQAIYEGRLRFRVHFKPWTDCGFSIGRQYNEAWKAVQLMHPKYRINPMWHTGGKHGVRYVDIYERVRVA